MTDVAASAPDHLSPAAAIARARDPDRFLCALFAPAERREALFTLIAYNGELARAREMGRHPLAALMRLQWWRDAVAAAAAGRPAMRHDVAGPLHAAITAGLLDPADLTAMADAREAEAEEGGIPTGAALDSYLRGTAGGFAVTAGRLLGVDAAPVLAALQEAGALYGLAGVLRSVPALATQGRCLLPGDALSAARLTAEAVVAKPESPDVRAVAATLAAPALQRAAEVRASLRHARLPRSAIAAALPLVLARRDLRRLAEPRVPFADAARGVGDRAAVVLAGLLSRV
jgi:phytoene synthase